MPSHSTNNITSMVTTAAAAPPAASSSSSIGGGHTTQPPRPPLNTHASTSGTSLSAQSHSTSVMTEDEEDLEDYRPGGYHPINIGDEFNLGRYVVVRKLGWGHFSTVWLARDNTTSRHVALKVVKSDGHYTETALDEIQLLQRVVSSSPTHAGRTHVVGLVDDFRHDGPNGSHVCMVFEVLGENLLGLIKRYQHRGVPQHIVKQIAKQVLLGLDYLHNQCRIIHTDLKPENVLICIEDVESVVQAELATCPAAVPTKLVGVPPSQGRLGNQTPRNESMFIVGSQPLPSPSSSFSSSPMFDKHGFGMSKISGGGSKGSTTNVAGGVGPSSGLARGNTAEGIGNELGNVNLGDDALTWEKKKAIIHQPGPSLLSQQMVNPPDLAPQSAHAPGSATSTTATPSQTVITTPATTPDSVQVKISTSVGSTAPSIPSISGTSQNPAAPSKSAQQTDDTSKNITQPSDPPPSEETGFARSNTFVSNISEDASSTHLNNLQDLSPHQPHHSEHGSHSHTPQPTGGHGDYIDESMIAPVAGDPNMLPPPFPYDPVSLERITVKIADLGNACWVDHHFTNDIQTRQYRCPEIILGTKWNESVDIWSAACLFFELLTGDYLFDPQPGGKYDKDDDHMAQVMELLGDMPKALTQHGKYSHEIFTRKGELRHISRLRYWPLDLVLKEKYLMEAEEAELLSSFLLPMMRYDSDARATAAEMVNHPWLKGVVVLGEEEIAESIHRARMDKLAELRRGSDNQPGESSNVTSESATARNSTSSGSQSEASKSNAATDGKDGNGLLEEVAKLGPAVKGLVGMGRI
ncbi:kinase-like domain-containing protein [Kockovaella imperatae]|uniref:non-specific serine/threonine protein kinase n=1 Tax=Kockovaella imperatae TaxID=4999 RepID=A0A1Y1UKW6_9TREE|nr:kinase-like domain-containing protein [Kockovaella imperatae]ORX38691.1 kinase-like domain-containing protein [Kockovaella imperatae]